MIYNFPKRICFVNFTEELVGNNRFFSLFKLCILGCNITRNIIEMYDIKINILLASWI
jgi:hypothetical protein